MVSYDKIALYDDSYDNSAIVKISALIAGIALISAIIIVYTVLSQNKKQREFYEAAVTQPIYYDEFGNAVDRSQIEYETGSGEQDTEEVTYITGDNVDFEVTGSIQYSTGTNHTSRTLKDEQILKLTDGEAWSYVSNGTFDKYPAVPYYTIASQLSQIRTVNTTKITVPIWYWEDPNDETNLNKITKTKTWEVNSKIAEMCEHIFNDIYEDPSQPVINIADKGMGTWVLRGKNHNKYKTLSAHSLGTAFDINPSTGTFNVNGVTYGNAYKNKAMPYSVWASLPETQKKYHVLYQDCPIVRIFKSYGFYWGGDWTSGTDCMHLAFLGDGGNARAIGQTNYMRYEN